MIYIFISAILFAVASYYTMPWINFIEANVAILMLVSAMRRSQDKTVLKLYIWGIIFSITAFYWIPETLQLFGDFDNVVSYALFAAYCLISSLQFVVCGLLYKLLSRSAFLRGTLLSFPLAWFLSEHFFPRLFPWYLANVHIVWNNFAALVEYLPLSVLGFVLLWWAEVILLSINKLKEGKGALTIRKNKGLHVIDFDRLITIAPILCFVWLIIGYLLNENTEKSFEHADQIKVALLQGNVDALKQNNDQEGFSVRRYGNLLAEAKQNKVDVAFLPESAIPIWIPETLGSVADTKFSVIGNAQLPVLYGGAAYREAGAQEPKKFNSVVGVDSSGRVAGMYHKKVLMPFGEYLPFEKIFPALRNFSPLSGDLSAGDLDKPIVLDVLSQTTGQTRAVAFGILVCYEDLLSHLAKDMKNRGAEVLVNFTNDIWYGRSYAARQHNLLAAWRAVETRRYLLRVTNTGLTTIIDPFGTIIGELSEFDEGIMIGDVAVIK